MKATEKRARLQQAFLTRRITSEPIGNGRSGRAFGVIMNVYVDGVRQGRLLSTWETQEQADRARDGVQAAMALLANAANAVTTSEDI